MKFLKYGSVAYGVVLLIGCQTAPQVQSSASTSTQEARVRLYGQNQKPTILQYELNGKKIKVNVGGNAGDAFASMIGTVKNTSLGIAPTETSKNLQKNNGILSKIFYKEIVIPAGHTIKVHSAFIGLSNRSQTPTQTVIQSQGSCRGADIVFTAQAGKDYEVVPTRANSTCDVTLLEVAPSGQLQRVDLNITQ